MENDPAQTPMASDEQRQELVSMIEAIKAKLSDFGAQQFASKNKLDANRRELLQQVLQKLQLAGVDLSNRASVGAFIAKLQEQNPPVAAQFEKAMSILLGDDPVVNSSDPNQQNGQTVPQGI